MYLVETYHSRPTDLLDLPRGCSHRSLASNHPLTIRYHRDAHDGETIVVPCESSLVFSRSSLLFLVLYRDIDAAYLIVETPRSMPATCET